MKDFRAHPSPSVCPLRKAFSLVELLTALGVIVVLAAILYPVTQTLVERARTTKCLANLRGIGVGVVTYAADNRQEWPFFGPYDPQSTTGSWLTSVIYASGEWNGLGKIYKSGGVPREAFYCPKDEPFKGYLNMQWDPPSGGISSSYLIRGWAQSYIHPVPFGKKLADVSRYSLVSCFFAYVKRNPSFVLTHHGGRYPVLFGDGRVKICAMPDFIDPKNPPDIWDRTNYQRMFWDHFDSE